MIMFTLDCFTEVLTRLCDQFVLQFIFSVLCTEPFVIQPGLIDISMVDSNVQTPVDITQYSSTAAQTSFKMIIPQTEHYHLHEGGFIIELLY